MISCMNLYYCIVYDETEQYYSEIHNSVSYTVLLILNQSISIQYQCETFYQIIRLVELPTALYSETTWNYHRQSAEYTHLTVCVVSEYCGRDEEKVDQKVRICFLTVKEKMIANCWLVKEKFLMMKWFYTHMKVKHYLSKLWKMQQSNVWCHWTEMSFRCDC